MCHPSSPIPELVGVLSLALAACPHARSSVYPGRESLVRRDGPLSVMRAFVTESSPRAAKRPSFRVPGKVLQRLVDTCRPHARPALMLIDPRSMLATRAHEEAFLPRRHARGRPSTTITIPRRRLLAAVSCVSYTE